ncbi:hypothetical protein SteCoe_29504 [Stentor coeruleus]|uniref:Uncharacterized protein n=1 Tax=Stentor coeruleus TaxID=5963 RepID=A0A1R2B5R1_9CILI|nr:hypothetical protein SteCoe_29504 [Stentor coeruleus]
MSSSEEDNFGWKECRGFFQIKKRYPLTYAKLLSAKNRLQDCPKSWEAICQHNLELFEKLIEENDPKALEENAFNICKKESSNTTNIEMCRTTLYSARITKIMSEINRINHLFTMMGKKEI